MLTPIEELEKAKAKEKSARDKEEDIVTKRRKAAMDRRKAEAKIHTATAFLIGETILKTKLTPEERRTIAGIFEREIVDDYPRLLLKTFLSPPRPLPPVGYTELKVAGK